MINRIIEKRHVLFDTSQVFLNKALNAIVPIVLIPYYNKQFGVEQYGELVFVQSMMTLLMLVSDYGFNVTGTRDVSISASDKRSLSMIVSSIYCVKLFLTIASVGVIFLLAHFASWPLATLGLYLMTFAAFAFQSLTPFWFFQGLRKNVLITIVNLISKIILLYLVWKMVHPDSKLITAPFIEWCSYAISFLLANVIILFSLKIPFVIPSRTEIFKQLLAGRDIFITTLINWMITGGSLLALKYVASAEELGYYGTFTRVIYYVFAILQPVNQAMFPYISAHFASGIRNGMLLVKRISTFYFSAIFLLAIVGGLVAPMGFAFFFDEIFMKKFNQYDTSFYLLFYWVCLVLINNFIGLQCLVAAGNDNVYRRYYSVNAVITIIGFLVLVPLYFSVGASMAMLSGELVLTVLLIRFFIRRSSITA